jgi:hypothetical protein
VEHAQYDINQSGFIQKRILMMRIATFFVAALIATLTLSTTQAVAEEEIYRWVDKDGVVHFGNRPEGHEDTEVVNIEKATDRDSQANSAPSSVFDRDPEPTYAQKLRDERAQGRKDAAEKQKEVDALCEVNRERVATLEPSTRVIIRLEDGSVTRMDDNYRLENLAESKAFIAENCDK